MMRDPSYSAVVAVYLAVLLLAACLLAAVGLFHGWQSPSGTRVVSRRRSRHVRPVDETGEPSFRGGAPTSLQVPRTIPVATPRPERKEARSDRAARPSRTLRIRAR